MAHPAKHPTGCLAAFLRFFTGSSASHGIPDVRTPSGLDAESAGTSAITFPYRVREAVLSPAERSFYHVLIQTIHNRATVCLKVRLADVLFVARPYENRAAQNRINQKHIDFLLCDPVTFHPLLGIELDDASHARLDRQERDAFVDQAFAAASLPLLHIRAQHAYTPVQLEAAIAPYLGHDRQPMTPLPTIHAASEAIRVQAESPPLCTHCGIPLVVRTVAKGSNQGKRFYGCKNYPQCRVMQPLDR